MLIHPFLAKISKAMTSNTLLANRMVSLDSSCTVGSKVAANMPPPGNSLHKRGNLFFLKNHVIGCTPNSPHKSYSPYKKKIEKLPRKNILMNLSSSLFHLPLASLVSPSRSQWPFFTERVDDENERVDYSTTLSSLLKRFMMILKGLIIQLQYLD